MAGFDPDIHHRRSIRLPEYDYCEPGAYFVTICTFGKECTLSEVQEGTITLSPRGHVIEQCWRHLPKAFPHIELDEFVIMPNHTHGILLITGDRSCRGEALASHISPKPSIPTASASPSSQAQRACGTKSGSLSAIIQNFKSVTTRRVNAAENAKSVLWQRNYYEHVVRNDQSLEEIREYIRANPWNWHLDEYHL